jgi:hypothetical protein
MELYDVVMKLTGPVRPLGETNEDARRLDNLKSLCGLVDRLVTEIDAVASGRGFRMASVKAAKDFAGNFLTRTLGIQEE